MGVAGFSVNFFYGLRGRPVAVVALRVVLVAGGIEVLMPNKARTGCFDSFKVLGDKKSERTSTGKRLVSSAFGEHYFVPEADHSPFWLGTVTVRSLFLSTHLLSRTVIGFRRDGIPRCRGRTSWPPLLSCRRVTTTSTEVGLLGRECRYGSALCSPTIFHIGFFFFCNLNFYLIREKEYTEKTFHNICTICNRTCVAVTNCDRLLSTICFPPGYHRTLPIFRQFRLPAMPPRLGYYINISFI